MYTKTVVGGIRSILGAFALLGTFHGATAGATDHHVTIALHVSAQGLDLSQPGDAQTFYTRLKDAARVVCTHGNRVDLAPAENPKVCYEQALAGAVRAAKAPMLTQIYLSTHTLGEAIGQGIGAPAQIAAK